MNIRQITKTVVSGVSGTGVGMIATHVLNQVTPPAVKLPAKVAIAAGKVTLGALAMYKANQYTDEIVDEVFDSIDSLKETLSNEEETV